MFSPPQLFFSLSPFLLFYRLCCLMIQGSEKGRSGTSLLVVKLSVPMVDYFIRKKRVDEITWKEVAIYQSTAQSEGSLGVQ